MIQDIIRSAIRTTGRTGIYQRLPDKHNNIVMYHSIGGDGPNNMSRKLFQTQIEWLVNTYDIVDLPNVLSDSNDKKIALTFDDGYRSFFNQVRPILHKYSVPGTVFIIGKTLKNERFVHDHPAKNREYLTRSQLLELCADPFITIGGHTYSHQKVSEIHDKNTLRAEINYGTKYIESKLGITIDRFCYPYNGWSQQARDIVSEQHDYAVRARGGVRLITPETDPYSLPRIDGAVNLTSLKFDISDFSKRLGAVADWLPEYHQTAQNI